MPSVCRRDAGAYRACEDERMDEPDLPFFIDLETQVWEALATADTDADRRLLSEDFLGVYPTGFSDRDAHVAQLADGPVMAQYRLHDARLHRITPEAVLLAYRADFRPPDVRKTQSMYISSLWQRRDGRWQNTVSQDTPRADPR